MSPARASAPLGDLLHQRVVVRKRVRLELRVDECAVDDHIEDAARSSAELGVDVEGLLQLGGQTGCRLLIASGSAVDDLNQHCAISRFCERANEI